MSFDFQLPRQLVDPNLLHRKSNLLLLLQPHLLAALRATRSVLRIFRTRALRARSFRLNVRGRTRVFYRTKLFRAILGSGIGANPLARFFDGVAAFLDG